MIDGYAHTIVVENPQPVMHELEFFLVKEAVKRHNDAVLKPPPEEDDEPNIPF